ncbi:MAG: diaminopimelate epimerase [Elusimicrobia bacterium GWB2_63_22]|nr:MAG: diaminopimelate epimerase [Elusimicrobia bacterium GWB2_63_22]
MKFWKMSGAGNDFVLLTGGGLGTGALKKLAVRLCGRRLAIGADGLLYVNKGRGGGVDVRYFNSDGSEAFCGNGSRCAAWWAWRSGLVKSRKFSLATLAGVLPAEIAGRDSVRMRMPDVASAALNFKGRYPSGVKAVHFLNTGVPHAVVPVGDAEKVDVEGLGRALRYNRAFGPAGANVNFVSLRGGLARIRTYERGVEGETLACGTGITAAAVALALSGKVKPPVRLAARSGGRFKVWLTVSGAGASDIRIQGPAKIVFKGEI